SASSSSGPQRPARGTAERASVRGSGGGAWGPQGATTVEMVLSRRRWGHAAHVRRGPRARALAAVLSIATLVLAPASARASGFHVYSCHTPSGQPAPADGWSPSTSGPETYAEDTCAQPGGALLAALGPHATRATNTDLASWGMGIPPWASMTGATLWRWEIGRASCRERVWVWVVVVG